MNVTLLLLLFYIEGFQTVLCCYMRNLKECDSLCVPLIGGKKKIRAHLTQVFSSTSSIFPSIRPLHLSSVLFYSFSPPVLNLFYFPHLCFCSPPLPQTTKIRFDENVSCLQMAHFTFSLLSHAFFSLAISFSFHSTSDTSSARFCPTESLTYVWFI